MKAELSIAEKNFDLKEWWRQLPFPYESCAITPGSRPDGFCFYQHIINIEAKLFGKTLWACGEANDRELAMTKAIAELVERSALVDWKNRNKGTTISSNGWAAHTSIELAKTAALLELIERDAGLSQWYTATPFLQISVRDLPLPIKYWCEMEVSRSEFPILKVLLTTTGLGPSVTCLFMNADGFGVSGHATRSILLESIESAVGEGCRAAHMAVRKSFWRETSALKVNEPLNIGPGAHSVYYAYHEPFPSWMFGDEISWDNAAAIWNLRIASAFSMKTDFEIVMSEPLAVAFASSRMALPLTWGPTTLEKILTMTTSKRFVIKPNEWNLKPHIIS